MIARFFQSLRCEEFPNAFIIIVYIFLYDSYSRTNAFVLIVSSTEYLMIGMKSIASIFLSEKASQAFTFVS